MSVKNRSYAAANSILSIQEIAAWSMMVIGVIAFLLATSFIGEGISGRSGPLASLSVLVGVGMIVSAMGVLVGGLLLLSSVQAARANIHTAEMTWEMLEMMRRGEKRSTNAEGAISPQSKVDTNEVIKIYKGYQFRRNTDGSSVSVAGKVFAGVLDAEKFIDNLVGQ